MEIIFSVFLGYRNSLIAKRKGKSTVLWVFLTILAFFTGEIIGSFFVTLFFFKAAPTPENILAFLMDHPLHAFFIFFCGLGGYLFTYYLLTRMPDQQKQEELE